MSKESKWTRPKVGEPEEDNTLPKAGAKLGGTRNTAFIWPWCFCDQRGVMDDV